MYCPETCHTLPPVAYCVLYHAGLNACCVAFGIQPFVHLTNHRENPMVSSQLGKYIYIYIYMSEAGQWPDHNPQHDCVDIDFASGHAGTVLGLTDLFGAVHGIEPEYQPGLCAAVQLLQVWPGGTRTGRQA